MEAQVEFQLSNSAVRDTFSERVQRDVVDALKYLDAHEVVGLLDMIKISLVTQSLTFISKVNKVEAGEEI
jgi:hypothetical protein